MNIPFVECGEHGSDRPAFLCIHLISEVGCGWNEPDKPDTESEFADCIHAWCDDCEDIGRLTTGYIEESFAQPQLICESCALRFKESAIIKKI